MKIIATLYADGAHLPKLNKQVIKGLVMGIHFLEISV